MSEGGGLRHAQWGDAQWRRLSDAVGGGEGRANGGTGGRISGGVNRGASPPDAPSRRANSLIFAAPLVVLMACLGVLAQGRPRADSRTREENATMRAAISATWVVCASNAMASSAVVGWGRNDFGQASPPLELGKTTALAAGLYHNLALQSDGRVVAWGWNSNGQCDVPADLRHVVAIDAGYKHSVALNRAGLVRCFGDNSAGQCDTPAKLGFVRAISVGDEFTLAVEANGTVRAWGLNTFGQSDVPANLNGVLRVAGGSQFALAQRTEGTVVAWGRNDFGQCNVPAKLGTVVDVVGGAWHAVALRADRSVVCWGRNEFGQLNVPADLGPVVQISGDRSNVTMVLLADGSVRHWGQWNEVWTNPTPPAGVGTWREIACGGYHAIGIPDQPPCPGDVNGDGVADGADLSILLSSWGACP